MAIAATESILTNTGAANLVEGIQWLRGSASGASSAQELQRPTRSVSLGSQTWSAYKFPGFTTANGFSTNLEGMVDVFEAAESWDLPVLCDEAGTLTSTFTATDGDGTSDTATDTTATITDVSGYTGRMYVDASSTATNGVPLEDTFTDTDSTSIDAHTPDTDTWLQGWTQQLGTAEVQSNYAELSTRNALGYTISTVDAHTTDYEARVYVNFPSAASSGYTNSTTFTRFGNGVFFRYGSSVDFFYAGLMRVDAYSGFGNRRLVLEKRVSGTRTTVAQVEYDDPGLDTDHEIYVKVDGNSIKVWAAEASTGVDPDNDTPLIDTSDSDLATNTEVGFGGFEGDATANSTSRGPVWFSDFKLILPSSGAGSSTSDAIGDIDFYSTIMDREVDGILTDVEPGTYSPTRSIPFGQGINTVIRSGTRGTKVTIDTKDLPIGTKVWKAGQSSVTSRRCTLRDFSITDSEAVHDSVDLSDAGVLDISTDEITVSSELYSACATEDPIFYTLGTGSAAAGLTENTVYYVIKTGTTNVIKLATSAANAGAGTAVNITGLSNGAVHHLVLHGGQDMFEWAGTHIDLGLVDVEIAASCADYTYRFIEYTGSSSNRIALIRVNQTKPKCWRYNFGFFSGGDTALIGCGSSSTTSERPCRLSLGTSAATVLFNDFGQGSYSGKNPLRLQACGYSSIFGNNLYGNSISMGGDGGDAQHVRITNNHLNGLDQHDAGDVFMASNIVTDEQMMLPAGETPSGAVNYGQFGYSRQGTASGPTVITHNTFVATGNALLKSTETCGSIDGTSQANIEANVSVINNLFSFNGETSTASASAFKLAYANMSPAVFTNNTLPEDSETTADATMAGKIGGANVSEADWNTDTGTSGTTFAATTVDDTFVPTGAGTGTVPDGVFSDAFGSVWVPGETQYVGGVDQASSPPTVANLNPTDDATGVSDAVTPGLEFSEDMAVGTGTIELRQASDDSVLDSIDAGDATINFSDKTEVTLTGLSLTGETGAMYIYIPSGAFVSLATALPFAGYTANTDWNFTVGSATTPATSASTLRRVIAHDIIRKRRR